MQPVWMKHDKHDKAKAKARDGGGREHQGGFQSAEFAMGGTREHAGAGGGGKRQLFGGGRAKDSLRVSKP